MTNKKTKLELTWIGKDERPRLEPRILLEDPELSYHAPHRVCEKDCFDNILIHGDNLLALKALEQEYAGKVKCVFIDPPYNTGSAFTHYDDGVEHSLWLSLMRDRLEIIKNLMSEDGSLWITIDDNEAHYLKVLCDDVFGRVNFIANIIWQKAYGPRSNAFLISDSHDHLLVYGKDKFNCKFGLLERSVQQTAKYKNPDNDPRGPWKAENSSISLLSGQRGKQFAKTGKSDNIFEILSPTGKKHMPPKNRCWAFSPKKYKELLGDNRITFGADGNARPSIKRFLSEITQGVIPQTIWFHEEVGHNQESSREIRALFPDNPFSTPKPERLLSRIIQLATEPNDLVLDSFAGSGTTGAVAHKMGRRWIMVELGGHCHTHIIPRIKKVIDGDDAGGITKTLNWKGGGGFRYYRLAPSLLEKDPWGNWVINDKYNSEMLAEAICKHEGFTYAPSETVYWQHGHSTEHDHIYVTTQTLSRAQLEVLSEEVGDESTLLVCCGAFRVKRDAFSNLTLKKIPNAVLNRCEFGRDDYSLEIADLPPLPDPLPEGEGTEEQAAVPNRKTRKKAASKKDANLSLFDEQETS